MWLVDLIWPKECELCGKYGMMVCRKCLLELSDAESKCPGCYKYSLGGTTHKSCKNKTALSGLYSRYAYRDPRVSKLVWAIKYEERWAVLEELLEDAKVPQINFDTLAFVPMGKKKRRSRGYNQALMIALILSRLWNKPLIEGLVKEDTDTSLANTATAEARRQVVSGVYSYEGPDLDGKRILLIDDVFTSGATMNEVARQLLNAGAKDIGGWSLAN